MILVEKDFDNPLIIAFKVEELKEGDEFKASWKEVEKSVREKLPKLKIIYAQVTISLDTWQSRISD